MVTRAAYCHPVRASYSAAMKAITVKLSDETLERLRKEARATGRSVSAMVRDCVENDRGGEGSCV